MSTYVFSKHDKPDDWTPEGLEALKQLSALNSHERFALVHRLLGTDACRKLGIYPVPADYLLSVVIPIYNERDTIEEVIHRVRECGIACEIILVDDGSTDGTRDLLDRMRDEPDLRVVFHEHNQGKGAAVRTGLQLVQGDAAVIQDADLEYHPAEYLYLLQPIIEGEADVVFGSRFLGDNQRVLYFWHYVANRLLTTLSNCFTNLNLTDMETCYKIFRREVVRQMSPTLREKGFGIEPEMTAKVASIPGIRIYERPITYHGRTYAEGKKITWRDGAWALWCILRYCRGIRAGRPLNMNSPTANSPTDDMPPSRP